MLELKDFKSWSKLMQPGDTVLLRVTYNYIIEDDEYGYKPEFTFFCSDKEIDNCIKIVAGKIKETFKQTVPVKKVETLHIESKLSAETLYFKDSEPYTMTKQL